MPNFAKVAKSGKIWSHWDSLVICLHETAEFHFLDQKPKLFPHKRTTFGDNFATSNVSDGLWTLSPVDEPVYLSVIIEIEACTNQRAISMSWRLNPRMINFLDSFGKR